MALTQEEIQGIQTAFFNALTQYYNNEKNGIDNNMSQFGIKSGASNIDLSEFSALNDKIGKLIGSIDNLESEYQNRKNSVLYFKNGNARKGKVEEYLKQLEEEAKAKLELAKEEDKYLLEELEVSTSRLKAAKTNAEYQHEQIRHSVKLAEIEADARKKHIKQIKAVFEEEEKVRRDGLASYETRERARKQHVENVKNKGAYDKDGHMRGLRSAFNQLLFAPLVDNFSKSLGKNRTETIPTGIVRQLISNPLQLGDKAMKMAATGKMDVSGMAGNVSSKLMSTGNPYAMAGGAILGILKTAFEMYSKVDKAASDYARKVGGGAVAQDKMRKSAAALADEMSKAWGRAYQAEKILANMSETSEALGRNLEYLSTQDLKAITDLKDFGISNATISQFDTLGISIERVSKEFASIYGSAGKKGLNASAVIKSVADNMKLAQNYTFAKGRKAIFEMAEKSAQLKFNLRDAESFANKVSTLEGAMKSAAQLSVLGGSFAMQGNPMTLLYNALNDVEGLQDQMLAMTKDLVYWDRQKGQLDMSAFDRQRLRAMSEATGIDYNELTTQAFNQGRIDRISRQIKPGTNKDVAEYIKNIAFIDEKGNAKIQFHDGNGKNDGEAKLLSEVLKDPELVNRLKGESEAKDLKEGATVGDILSSTMTIQDRLDSIVQVLQNVIAKAIMGIADKYLGDKLAEKAFGLKGKEKEQFEKFSEVLTSDNAKDQMALMSHSEKEILRKMGVLNKNYEFQDRPYSRVEVGSLYAQAIGDQKEPKKYAKGGYTGDGNPNEIAGLVHKGEYVIDADTTKSMFSDVKNGENPMKFKDFAQRVSSGIKNKVDNFIDGHESVKVEFGTLHLELGGVTKDVDMNAFADLLLSNHSFIETLIQKMATTRDFGYRKDDAQFKYISHPYTI